MKEIDFSGMTAKELVEFYNSIYPDKPVKKFSSKETALKRCAAAAAEVKGKKLSNGVKKSWADPEVRVRRSQRHGVKVDGVEFTSLQAAYREFGLDQKDHRAFRMELKASMPKKLERHGKTWQAFER